LAPVVTNRIVKLIVVMIELMASNQQFGLLKRFQPSRIYVICENALFA
jgi:hypothetical protein